MGLWTLDDIAWGRFDPARVDPDILRAVKAASMVEANSADYVAYLENVFADDEEMRGLVRAWGDEERQHGDALARWAELADPTWRFAPRLASFRTNYRLPLDARESVRGSRAGELLARCVVECGTSSFYSAIRDATDEPVLKEICHRIAGDEFRHYKLFYDGLQLYAPRDRLSLLTRIRVALGRVQEADDDELSVAYWCANVENTPQASPYDRKACAAAYELRATRLYRYGHVARGLFMIARAVGVNPQGHLVNLASRAAWRMMQARTRRLERIAA
jgi:rubrerythrin